MSATAEAYEALKLLNASNVGTHSAKIFKMPQSLDPTPATDFRKFYSSKASREFISLQHKEILDTTYFHFFDGITSAEVLCDWIVPPYTGEEGLRMDIHFLIQCMPIVAESLQEL